MVSLTFIRWIVIYPVDSAIQQLNNWGHRTLLKLSVKYNDKNANTNGIYKWYIRHRQRLTVFNLKIMGTRGTDDLLWSASTPLSVNNHVSNLH